MRRALFVLAALALSVVAEPPVPQGQYGAPSSFSQGGYPGAGASGFGNGQNAGGDEPMVTHEQDFQQSPGVIWGKYSVVLPDGRTQKVEYDADEDGFHPIITYEEPEDNGLGGAGGYSNGGYSSGGQGGFGNGEQARYQSGGHSSGQGSYHSGGSRRGGYSNGGQGGYN